MKTLLTSLLVVSSFASSVLAFDNPTFTVLTRKHHSNKPIYIKTELENLTANDAFDGKYFKIVLGKNSEAIKFDEENNDIKIKAATAYYHLSRARNFWVNEMKSKRPDEIGKMIIRLEITNEFSELGHFANDNKTPITNNAVSVPGGETPEWVPAEKQDKWNQEIWFRPKEVILTKDLPKIPGDNPLTSQLELLDRPMVNFARSKFNKSLLEYLFYPDYVSTPLYVNIFRMVGTVAVTKAVIEGSRYLDGLFAEKYYYLDAAMVPEIAYHEYAHHIFSDKLVLSHSTPVVEGLADYFAAVMTDKRRVFEKVRNHSTANAKDRESKQLYAHQLENNSKATADFTLSVLWKIRENLDPTIADRLVLESRNLLSTESANIYDSLLRALLETCKTVCENPERDRLELFKIFGQKGF